MGIRSIILIAAVLGCCNLSAQNAYPYPSLSPKGHISQIVGNTVIKVSYERPSVRGRAIFGDLVPYNELWRTGAGHCTKISFSLPVTVEGNEISAGTYSLFTIPQKESWIVIFNSDTTLYGTSGYDEKKDILRFSVESNMSSRKYEALTFDIDIIPDNARIFMSWENTTVSFAVETSTAVEIERFIDAELMTGRESNSNIYAGAAEYYYFMDQHLDRGIKLSRMALELDQNNGWARSLQIKMLVKTGDSAGALEVLDAGIEALRSDTNITPEELDREINYYEQMRKSILEETKID